MEIRITGCDGAECEQSMVVVNAEAAAREHVEADDRIDVGNAEIRQISDTGQHRIPGDGTGAEARQNRTENADLTVEHYGLRHADLDAQFLCYSTVHHAGA